MRKMTVFLQWASLLMTMGGLVLSNETAAQSTYAYIPNASDGVVSEIDGRKVWIADRAGVIRVFDSGNLLLDSETTHAQATAVKWPAAVPDRRAGQATVLTAATSVSPDELTRRSNERSVTVEVTPLDLSAGPGTLDFRIVLDTHSIALDYDLVRITMLVDDRGNEYRAASWDGTAGGHHVEGLLKFVGRDRILNSGASFLEMRMAGVAGVPSRTFRWNLQR